MQAVMRRRGGLFVAAALAVALGIAGPASASGGKRALRAAAAPKRELSPVRSVTLPGGTTVKRFQQRVAGAPVLGGEAVISKAPGSAPRLVADTTAPAIQAPPGTRVSESQAVAAARSDVGLESLRGSVSADLAIQPGRGGTLVWRVLVPAARPLGDFEVLVAARLGEVLHKANLIRDFRSGHAKLYNPNPVVERARSGSLRGLQGDHHDRDT